MNDRDDIVIIIEDVSYSLLLGTVVPYQQIQMGLTARIKCLLL